MGNTTFTSLCCGRAPGNTKRPSASSNQAIQRYKERAVPSAAKFKRQFSYERTIHFTATEEDEEDKGPDKKDEVS